MFVSGIGRHSILLLVLLFGKLLDLPTLRERAVCLILSVWSPLMENHPNGETLHKGPIIFGHLDSLQKPSQWAIHSFLVLLSIYCARLGLGLGDTRRHNTLRNQPSRWSLPQLWYNLSRFKMLDFPKTQITHSIHASNCPFSFKCRHEHLNWVWIFNPTFKCINHVKAFSFLNKMA